MTVQVDVLRVLKEEQELERLQELHVLVPSQEICLAGEPKPLFQYSLVEAPTGVETMNWDYLVTTMVQVQ